MSEFNKLHNVHFRSHNNNLRTAKEIVTRGSQPIVQLSTSFLPQRSDLLLSAFTYSCKGYVNVIKHR
ncbi:MAG: hypothetical protein GPI94_17030 [Microcystis aeruginosa LG13-03]|nr:hypothetical protein [Microcystis aeruginosa LG13-13]NCR05533.1 hypothetical protein [Microcystis aeruginosa LG13-03]